ncbi:histidine phosphatase family protein [Enterococcus sp. DIV0197]|uniref:histidine phosphatase family protein n=1 Tax=unclassified Enterococcus TaxID=2608891 RepID=UPI003D2E4819
MKKWLKVVGMIGLMFSLSACQETNSATSTEKEANKAPDQVEIYLARHGKTMLNTTDRSQGWIDAPLTPAGIAVAEDLGRGLADVDFDAVYSSDSGRAVETATLVLKNNGQEKLLDTLHTDKRLREFNFGTYEGIPNPEMWGEIAKEQGKTLEEWQNEMGEEGFVKTIQGFADTLHELDEKKLEELGKEHDVAADEVSWRAEDYQTVIDRVSSAVADIVKTAEEKGQDKILITSHGMTIASFVASIDESAEVPPTGLKNASVCKIIYQDGKYTVESVNDLSYLEKGAKDK